LLCAGACWGPGSSSAAGCRPCRSAASAAPNPAPAGAVIVIMFTISAKHQCHRRSAPGAVECAGVWPLRSTVESTAQQRTTLVCARALGHCLGLLKHTCLLVQVTAPALVCLLHCAALLCLQAWLQEPLLACKTAT
jgi:hypothetical protein